MYWKVGNELREGIEYPIYEYFYWDDTSKDLKIARFIAESDDYFKFWYEQNKKL